MKLGTRDFLIQRNWLNANGGLCALSYLTTPNFSLSVSPPSQTVPSTGGTTLQNYTITMTPSNGFKDTVNYSVSGLPAGATTSPTTITGVFTVTVLAGTTAKSYPLTITGTSGSLVRTALATLVVSPPPTPTFTISISPSSRTVTRPSSGSVSTTYIVKLAPQNAFNSSVSLSASGTRTGLTVGVSPSSVAGGSGTATLTATVTRSASRATRTLTVTATGSGVTKTASATIAIQ